ncbi:MAG: hypothetical protein LBH63_05660 [Clostridiales Family XIII bacterium]|jgi:hypothetical protein|nr:hypothetical protein [Clostridiales Family XIII bacterium]
MGIYAGICPIKIISQSVAFYREIMYDEKYVNILTSMTRLSPREGEQAPADGLRQYSREFRYEEDRDKQK